VICAPGTIQPHKKFKGQVYILTKEEGGRHTPFFSGVSAAVLRADDGRDGEFEVEAGVEMVMPGDNVEVEVELMVPVALEKACGSRFGKAGTRWAPAL
jgi:elongation factor Tu